jgi:glycosidase
MIVVLQNVLKFWLDKGVAGFRVDAFKYAYEVKNISLNEQLPVSINIWIRL